MGWAVLPAWLPILVLVLCSSPAHPKLSLPGINTWLVQDVSTSESIPATRSFASSATIGDSQLFVFGGALYSAGEPFRSSVVDHVWMLTSTSFRWFLVTNIPSGPRYGQVSAALPWRPTSVVMYGGLSTGAGFASPTYVFDTTDYSWTEMLPHATEDPPTNVIFASAAPLRDCVVVFGGATLDVKSSTLDSTWAFCKPASNTSLGLWRRVNVGTTAPSPRSAHTSASFMDTLFVFGGCSVFDPESQSCTFDVLDDVWRLDCDSAACTSGKWTQMFAALSFASVYGCAATFSGGIGIMPGATVARPGTNELYILQRINDTTFDLTLADTPPLSNPPEERFGAVLSTVFGNKTLAVWGGVQGIFFAPVVDDLWTRRVSPEYDLDLFAWNAFPYKAQPLPRLSAATSLQGQQIVMFGGLNLGMQTLGDTWVFSLSDSNWMQLRFKSSHTPRARHGHSLTRYDNIGLVLIGGSHEGVNGQPVYAKGVWALKGGATIFNWHQLTATGASTVEFTSFHSTVATPLGLLVFGGETAASNLGVFNAVSFQSTNQLRLLSFANGEQTPVWSVVTPRTPTAPSHRFGHVATFSQQAGNMIVHGGFDGVKYFNDTWVFSLANMTWSRIDPLSFRGTRPPTLPAMAFGLAVPVSSTKVIITGGTNGTSVVNQTLLGQYDAQNNWVLDAIVTEGDPERVFAAAVPNPLNASKFFNRASGMISMFGMKGTGIPLTSIGTLSLGCPPGTFAPDFSDNKCEPCRVGYFSPTPGATCTPCPGDASTAGVGAVDQSQCDTCLGDLCHDHGKCTLVNFEATCSCDVGWAGSNCNQSTVAIGMGALWVSAYLLSLCLRCFAVAQSVSSTTFSCKNSFFWKANANLQRWNALGKLTLGRCSSTDVSAKEPLVKSGRVNGTNDALLSRSSGRN
eukprot:m.378572 g.378572  ORF g.378572 m.378572 type:complete len:911 (-) comp20026_c1_seq18:853-3585(-)